MPITNRINFPSLNIIGPATTIKNGLQSDITRLIERMNGAEEILNALPTSKKFDLPIIRILEDGKQMNKKLTLTICAGKERPLTLLMPDGEITLDGESCSEKLWQWW